ncbi:hypothetical protein GOBAR_DD30989 [Gossypium barbadense]|nr:hypothetical protein GOBAR_DD30989 [Gossypium barbadense]
MKVKRERVEGKKKEGNAARYVTRSQAIKILQVSLSDFSIDTLSVICFTSVTFLYGFIEFVSRAAAERVLELYNGVPMPNSEQNFRLNWAALGYGEKRQEEGPDYTIFVGDLAADVSDYMLQETFKAVYPSVKSAKVVTDRTSC